MVKLMAAQEIKYSAKLDYNYVLFMFQKKKEAKSNN